MSINVSQIFVRYPDPNDTASLLIDVLKKQPGIPSFVVTRTGTPWLAVASGDNAPSPEVARGLSRALEAAAIWYGLAGNALAYRMIRYHLGKEAERIQEPPEIFKPGGPFPLPAYRDVERELYQRLREAGIPAEYIYLFAEEIGVAGGSGRKPDALLARGGRTEAFAHRVPRRGTDGVRTLFDLYKEGEQTVYEKLSLHGAFDEDRAQHLFRTLEEVCRRRMLPAGWKVRFVAEAPANPELGPRLAGAYARGKFSFEFDARSESAVNL